MASSFPSGAGVSLPSAQPPPPPSRPPTVAQTAGCGALAQPSIAARKAQSSAANILLRRGDRDMVSPCDGAPEGAPIAIYLRYTPTLPLFNPCIPAPTPSPGR